MVDVPRTRMFPSRRLATGRMASVACLSGGLIAVIVYLTPFTPPGSRGGGLLSGETVMAIGVAAWFVPWDRLPWWASLGVVAATVANVGSAQYFGLTHYVVPFYVMIFALLGVGYGRWFAVAFSPFAFTVAIASIVVAPGPPPVDEVVSAVVAVAVAVVVGESMALVGARLRGFQRAVIESERRASEAFEREKDVSRRLAALDEMKNTFLQAVSHELRTPLTVILGGALTLERTVGSLSEQEVRDLARRTAANARKLDRLLGDLLDLDRLQQGILLAHIQPTELGALVRGVIEESEALSTGRIRLDAERVVAEVDGAKVERIVENLMTNAMKHTRPDASILIRVRPRDGGVMIAVEDDGPGVPERMKEAVFEPFRRGQDPRTPGTGIGLALVSKFAELHGGRAWVQDRAGGGASFRVWLPVTPPGAPAPPTSLAARPATAGDAPDGRAAAPLATR